METPCHRGKNRKYAANSKLAKHTGMPQRLYLRFLCVKRAVCSWVPDFAAYFRRAVPEVRGKIKIGRPDPGFAFPRPAVLLSKIRLCSEVSDFSPHFRKTRLCIVSKSVNRSIRDNIQLSRKRQRAVVGKPNNDPSLSPPHVESAATVSLETSYRNAKQPSKATIGNAAFRLQLLSK